MTARARSTGAARALEQVDGWDVPIAAVAVVDPDGVLAHRGPVDTMLRVASVSKLVTTYAVLVAVEEGTIGLGDDVDGHGATLRHLLAHAGGYGFDGDKPIVAPGRRRIYSNTGIELAARHLETAAAMPFATYLDEAVLTPLAMTSSTLPGSPAHQLRSTVGDLSRFAAELLAPSLIAAATLADATTVQFAGLGGMLPGIGRFQPLDWGLGFELRDAKVPHWTGHRNSPGTFGHFGGSGTFLWVDPDAAVALICLTDREFGPWALEAWPPLADAVVAGAGPPAA